MSVKIIATPVQGSDLKTGDLFSMKGQAYWNMFPNFIGVGQGVYIRTADSAEFADDADEIVYRIEIVRDEETDPLYLLESIVHASSVEFGDETVTLTFPKVILQNILDLIERAKEGR